MQPAPWEPRIYRGGARCRFSVAQAQNAAAVVERQQQHEEMTKGKKQMRRLVTPTTVLAGSGLLLALQAGVPAGADEQDHRTRQDNRYSHNNARTYGDSSQWRHRRHGYTRRQQSWSGSSQYSRYGSGKYGSYGGSSGRYHRDTNQESNFRGRNGSSGHYRQSSNQNGNSGYNGSDRINQPHDNGKHKGWSKHDG